MMRQFETGPLPAAALDAMEVFARDHLDAVRTLLADPDCTALTIILLPAPVDHRDWRRAVARDLARAATPKRVNFISGQPGDAREATLRFLADAPGVTGQYLVCHDSDCASQTASPA